MVLSTWSSMSEHQVCTGQMDFVSSPEGFLLVMKPRCEGGLAPYWEHFDQWEARTSPSASLPTANTALGMVFPYSPSGDISLVGECAPAKLRLVSLEFIAKLGQGCDISPHVCFPPYFNPLFLHSYCPGVSPLSRTWAHTQASPPLFSRIAKLTRDLVCQEVMEASGWMGRHERKVPHLLTLTSYMADLLQLKQAGIYYS